MISMPSRPKTLYIIAVISCVAALLISLFPGHLPFGTEILFEVVDELSLAWIGVAVGVILFGVALWKTLRGITTQIDRSSITQVDPEVPSESAVPNAAANLSSLYNDASESFDEEGQIERRVAMYGRRAKNHDDVPDHIENFLDEMAVTAGEVYATENSVSSEKAMEAIEQGSWTDDRVVAAFMRTNADGKEEFTKWERFVAWLTPKKTFEKRVKKVLEEAGDSTETYLTYENVSYEVGGESK